MTKPRTLKDAEAVIEILKAEIERLEKDVKAIPAISSIRVALGFYGNESNWRRGHIADDEGLIAREALEMIARTAPP